MEDYYIGTIMIWPAALIPHGWLPCDGRFLAKSDYQALFSLIGFNFGQLGTDKFALPDYRARAPVGIAPTQPGYGVGQRGGSTTVPLTAANFPAHSHPLNAVSAAGTSTSFAGGVVLAGAGTSANVPTPPAIYGPGSAATNVALAPNSIGGAGGSAPRNNVQPSLALNFIIATTGHYPSRS